MGGVVVRLSFSGLDPEHNFTIAPLRGAMPLVWLADGLTGIETPAVKNWVEVPLGEFIYTDSHGSIRRQGPGVVAKKRILEDRVIESINECPSKTSFSVLDEVQHGGALGSAVSITRELIREQGFKPLLTVVAAQDIRPTVMAQPKSALYRLLASNSIPNTHVTVVPMPLITVDRRDLLDTVCYKGSPDDDNILPEKFETIRNHKAEVLFRTLGSCARNASLRHEPGTWEGLINSQGLTGMFESNRIESWVAEIVRHMDILGQSEALKA